MKKITLLIFLFLIQSSFSQQSIDSLQLKYHQFDFWIGQWDVYDYESDTIVGKSIIIPIINGLGLLENYTATKSKYEGKSLNKYNPAKNRWEQYWIDNSGLTLYLTGNYIDNKMVLTDSETRDTTKRLNKIEWNKTIDGSIRQTWSFSQDAGTTWSIVFDGLYKKNKDY